MRTSKLIHIVSCHAEGEVGDVIVGGIAPPPGDTLWAQRNFIATDETLRNFVLNEPRGGVFRHVNLLVPPKDPRAQMGFIIMEPQDTPPMSGSNSICVATVLLDTGIVPMTEPTTTLTLEAPGGVMVKLTDREFDLLLAFVERPRVVLTREQLSDLVASREPAPFDRSIDMQLVRLRKKIESRPDMPDMIKTVRNRGYIFTPEVMGDAK